MSQADKPAPDLKIGDVADFRHAGDTGLVVQFDFRIDMDINADVRAAAAAITAAGLPGIVELVPSFCSVLIHYDPTSTSSADLMRAIARLPIRREEANSPARTFVLPVLYGGEHGPDLENVAAQTDLSVAEVIALHASCSYRVYMLGFLPGYAYMGDVPERLRLSRLETPRTKVPAGSVAITGKLTAVYPVESPGGWLLLGHTPVRLFDAGAPEPSLLAPGDRVRFEPISSYGAYREIVRACVEGTWQPRSEPLPP